MLVTRLYLQLGELPRFLWKDRNQGLQFNRCFLRVVGLSAHQVFKLPD